MTKRSQYLMFLKYTRQWIKAQTGYSPSYLSRVNVGKVKLTRAFSERCAYKLGESEETLFSKS